MEKDGEKVDDLGRRPAFDIEVDGQAHMEDIDVGDRQVRFGGETDVFMKDLSVGSVVLEGNSAYMDQVSISGMGDEALKLIDTKADIHNLSIELGYRYGLTARNSEFLMTDSTIDALKYDLRFRAGVVADLYDVEADEILDLARGGEVQTAQNGVLNEIVSTTDEQLMAEEIISKIDTVLGLLVAYFFLEDIHSLVS